MLGQGHPGAAQRRLGATLNNSFPGLPDGLGERLGTECLRKEWFCDRLRDFMPCLRRFPHQRKYPGARRCAVPARDNQPLIGLEREGWELHLGHRAGSVSSHSTMRFCTASAGRIASSWSLLSSSVSPRRKASTSLHPTRAKEEAAIVSLHRPSRPRIKSTAPISPR